jgi:Zn-dependent M28 family amino/carboxypeptidase
MLEVARAAAGRRFARTLRFVGFDLEERGSRGSTRYVEAGLADDVVATLILECVGFTDDSQDSPPGLPLGDAGDALFIAANADSRALAQRMLAINHALELIPLRAVVAGGDGAHFFTGPLLRSDNGPFWLRGLPAVMLTDSANYRNPNYHEASDTPETLDPEFLAAATRLVAATVGVLAELEP